MGLLRFIVEETLNCVRLSSENRESARLMREVLVDHSPRRRAVEVRVVRKSGDVLQMRGQPTLEWRMTLFSLAQATARSDR